MRACYACGGEIPDDRKILREEECPHCSRDLHCCLNCRFHDPAVSNQCSEPQAEPVLDKERANFCEYFSFAGTPGRPKPVADRGGARDLAPAVPGSVRGAQPDRGSGPSGPLWFRK
ncbi:MAG: hypothetical protein ACE5JH_05170 [Acidobacteriota bacterium]